MHILYTIASPMRGNSSWMIHHANPGCILCMSCTLLRDSYPISEHAGPCMRRPAAAVPHEDGPNGEQGALTNTRVPDPRIYSVSHVELHTQGFSEGGHRPGLCHARFPWLRGSLAIVSTALALLAGQRSLCSHQITIISMWKSMAFRS